MSLLLVGDALEQLRTLGDETVHCCVTSPPYWALRDYGVAGQIGLEADFDDYLDRISDVFAEVHRVLRGDGTLWMNMGDGYASDAWGGSPGAVTLEGGRENLDEARKARTGPRLPAPHDASGPRFGHRSSFRRDRAPRIDRPHRGVARLKPKDLIGMPWRVAFRLQADGWYLRSDIIWHKPSAMPESVKDRPTKSHEYLFLLSKREKYFYDGDSIREPVTAPEANTYDDQARAFTRRRETVVEPHQGPMTASGNKVRILGSERGRPDGPGADRGVSFPWHGSTRNKRDVWTIPSEPFAGAHFATYPRELVRPCIRAGSPRGGVVLDPFFGSGTTGAVCDEEGRDWIGIELNPEYAAMARRRLTEKQETFA